MERDVRWSKRKVWNREMRDTERLKKEWERKREKTRDRKKRERREGKEKEKRERRDEIEEGERVAQVKNGFSKEK